VFVFELPETPSEISPMNNKNLKKINKKNQIKNKKKWHNGPFKV